MVLQGAVLVAVIKPDEWRTPAKDLPVQRYVLSATKPQVLQVPPGYCTANMDLTGDALLLICSSGRIEDAKADDFRFPADYWRIAS